MATINYNGMELEEFTSKKPVAFPKGTRAVFWEDNIAKDIFRFEGEIISYLPYLKDPAVPFSCIRHNGSHATFAHCVLLPDTPKPHRATNRELARWLAQGNGELTRGSEDRYGRGPYTKTYLYYSTDEQDNPVPSECRVRKWSDTE